MTSINLQGIGDISNRRLIERLSGWRLWAFLGLFFANLLLLFMFSVYEWQLDGMMHTIVFGIYFSQIALFALVIGTFRFPLTIKVANCCGASLYFSWVGCQLFGSDGLLYLFVASVIQSMVIVFASTYVWWRNKNLVFQFGIRDLLVIITAFAIGIPSLRFLSHGSRWNIGYSGYLAETMSVFVIPFLNAGWCLVVLCCLVSGILPKQLPNPFSKPNAQAKDKSVEVHRAVSLTVLTLGLVLCEAIVFYVAGGLDSLGHVAYRTVYLGWLFLSMMPVIGLEAKPRGFEA